MKPLVIECALLVGLLVSGARCGDEDPIYVYPCPHFAAAPVIDGVLSDACWQSSALVSGFMVERRNKNRSLAMAQTSLLVGYDDQYLYFGVRSYQRFPGEDLSDETLRSETLRIFIDPKHDQSNYYLLIADLTGSLRQSAKTQPMWKSKSVMKMKIMPESWVLELAIPWQDLGVEIPKPNRIIGFNVVRFHYPAAGARSEEVSTWAQLRGSYADPRLFSLLGLSTTAETLGPLTAELRKGNRTGPIHFFEHDGYAGKTYLERAQTAVGRLEASLSEALGQLETLLADLAAEDQNVGSEAARAVVAKRIETAKMRVAPFSRCLRSAKRLNAAEWVRMSIQMAEVEQQLTNSYWEARLEVLLVQI
jgi:hypothetical protein